MITTPPSISIIHYPGSSSNRRKWSLTVLFRHSMLRYSRAKTCLKHPNFLKVRGACEPQVTHNTHNGSGDGSCAERCFHHTTCPNADYELFKNSNVDNRFRSWNYRGCWPLLPKLDAWCAPTSPEPSRGTTPLCLLERLATWTGLSLKLAPTRL